MGKEHVRKICERIVKRFGGSAEFADDSSDTIGYKKDIEIPDSLDMSKMDGKIFI